MTPNPTDHKPEIPGLPDYPISEELEKLKSRLRQYASMGLNTTLGPQQTKQWVFDPDQLVEFIQSQIAIERVLAKIEEVCTARDMIPHYQPDAIDQLQGRTAHNEYIKKRLGELKAQLTTPNKDGGSNE